MSEKIWSDAAWNDYLYWQSQDKKTLRRINLLIQDIERNGCMEGIGRPEALSGDLAGEFSRPRPWEPRRMRGKKALCAWKRGAVV